MNDILLVFYVLFIFLLLKWNFFRIIISKHVFRFENFLFLHSFEKQHSGNSFKVVSVLFFIFIFLYIPCPRHFTQMNLLVLPSYFSLQPPISFTWDSDFSCPLHPSSLCFFQLDYPPCGPSLCKTIHLDLTWWIHKEFLLSSIFSKNSSFFGSSAVLNVLDSCIVLAYDFECINKNRIIPSKT